MHAGKIHEVFSPSPLLLLSFASTQFLLLPLRRDMHFYFLVEVLLLTSVLKQREVPATVSSFYVSVLNTAMLRASTAAVVLGCFYFCPFCLLYTSDAADE